MYFKYCGNIPTKNNAYLLLILILILALKSGTSLCCYHSRPVLPTLQQTTLVNMVVFTKEDRILI